MYLLVFYISLRPSHDYERRIEYFIDDISSEYKKTMRGTAYVFKSTLSFSEITEKVSNIFKYAHPYSLGEFILLDLNNIEDINSKIDGYLPEKDWDAIKKIYNKK